MEDEFDTMEDEAILTARDFFKIIRKRIWWVLGALVLGVLVAVLITQLWYNKSVQNYTLGFEIVYPDVASGKYPDGSDFLITDSITRNVLGDIKSGKYSQAHANEFGGIDIDEMIGAGDITITENAPSQASARRSYTLTVKAKYFDSQAQATSFMKAVASYPVNRVGTVMLAKEYDIYLSVYESADTYDAKMQVLQLQKEYLENSYNKIRNYDASTEKFAAALGTLFTVEQQQALKDKISANHYVYNVDAYKVWAVQRKAIINNTIAENNAVIASQTEKRNDAAKELNGNGQALAGNNEYDTIIAKYVEKNEILNNEVKRIDSALTAIQKYTVESTAEYEKKQEFDALLGKYLQDLTQATDRLKTVAVGVYNDNSRVIYAKAEADIEGGMNVAISVLLGLFIALIIASIVVFVIDAPKYKRAMLESKNAKPENSTPVGGGGWGISCGEREQ